MSFDQIITVGLNPTVDRVIEVPDLRVGEHLKGRLRSRQPAGKAFNVSRALAALGVPSCAMGFLGEESVELFDLAARVHGVQTQWTLVSARTRENITLLDPINGTSTHIRDAGSNVSPDDVSRLAAELEKACSVEALIVFCGSLPPGVDAHQLGQLLDLCASRGAKVAVDTSGEALRRAAASKLWLIKPNAEELAELVGHPISDEGELIAVGRSLAERIPFVLITRGGEGAYLFEARKAWKAQLTVPGELIRSTVGCGDAFLAGFLASQFRGEPPEHSLLNATALAAASAMSDMPASFSLNDYEQFKGEVRLACVIPS